LHERRRLDSDGLAASDLSAAMFELCLVGVTVIYELLGQARQPHGERG